MAREIVSMANLNRRMPEHGRIRIGEKVQTKNGKLAPSKLKEFRFTSHDKSVLQQIAALYGGEVKAWEKAWEVKTTAAEIPVVLPPEPLSGPVYELWSGGGCQRRCDGETAQIPQSGPDGAEMVDVPCLCVEAGALSCKPTTRLTVVLPDVSFGGGWRIESHGWHVAHEMPGMVEAILQFAQRGFTRATLALEQRTSVQNGKTMHYVVPVLRPEVSLQALMDGEGGMKALAKAPNLVAIETEKAAERMAAVLPNIDIDTSWEDNDDVIVDAEIVEEARDEPSVPETSGTAGPASSTSDEQPMAEAMAAVGLEVRRKHMHVLLKELGMGPVERHALAKRVTNGMCTSSNSLGLEELDKVIAALKAIRAGTAELSSIDENGMAVVVTL